MMRDFTIVATASEVQVDEAKKAGWLEVIALLLGTILPFIVGVSVAYAFGYTDAVTLTTIGAGPSLISWGLSLARQLGRFDIMALSIIAERRAESDPGDDLYAPSRGLHAPGTTPRPQWFSGDWPER